MLHIFMQAAPSGAGISGSLMANIMPFALIGLVFYFLFIRPQNKRLKEHQEMLAAVSRGDTVVTTGGLIGKVTKVGEEELTLDIGGGTKVKVVKSMLASVRNSSAKPANDIGAAKKGK